MWKYDLALNNIQWLIFLYTPSNIMKDDLRLQWTNETHFFIKIYLSFYSQKGPQFVVSLRDRWRDICTERGLLLAPYLLLWAKACQSVPTLAPSCKLRCLWSAACPSLDSRFSALCLNLPARFSSGGLLPFTRLLDPTALTRSSVY